MNNAVIILAGGLGSRANNGVPKQFVEINGTPIFVYSIYPFLDFVDFIVVSCEKAYMEYAFLKLKENIKSKKIFVVEGGSTGLESALNGFKRIDESGEPFDCVFIHDAARPFLKKNTILNCINLLDMYGYIFSGTKMAESVYNQLTSETMRKDNLFRIVSPHAFKYDFLKKNYNDAIESQELTIFNYLVSKGFAVHIAESDDSNFKITTPEQLEIAIKLLKYDERIK